MPHHSPVPLASSALEMAKVWYASALLVALAAVAAGPAAARDVCGDAGVPTPAPTGQVAPSPQPSPTVPGKTRPLIVAHRGASAYLPEHTIEAYTLAIESGVDYIEPDLVSTKDGVLIARHEPNIIGTTDVASRPEFASRKRNATVDGVVDVGFFVSDFTLAELKTLGAIQAMADRDQSYNGQFKIPTFDQVIELAKKKSKETGRTIGLYPETKHSIYHHNIGLPLEEKLLAALENAGWTDASAPVVIQSFEQANLMELRKKTKVQLAQLVNGGSIDPRTGAIKGDTKPYDWVVSGRNGSSLDLLTPSGLKEVASYANIIAPYKRYLVSTVALKLDAATGKAVDANGDGKITEADYKTLENPQLFKDAHAAGLKVHTWTFRDEGYRLAADYESDPAQEYLQFFRLGIDGLFSDNCKTAVPVRDQFVASA